MKKDKLGLIPNQRIGNKLDTEHQYEASSEMEARDLFDLAVKRLFDVNNWALICGPLSAKFTLTDESGQIVKRAPKPGDLFRIDIPGPGPSAGDGYDWVQVEALDDDRNPHKEEESVTIRVRPASRPSTQDQETAHFFSEDATSSFRVIRRGRLVIAKVHGRNEVPNTRVERAKDKIRNAVVSAGAVAGAANPQWKSLVKGLLDRSAEKPDNGIKI
jgi:hypothetical protein